MTRPIHSDPEWMQIFLRRAATYFENRPTDGEDRAYWSNVYNAENCRKIADDIERLCEALRDCHHVLHKLMAIVPGNDSAVDEMAKVMKKARAALGEKE